MLGATETSGFDGGFDGGFIVIQWDFILISWGRMGFYSNFFGILERFHNCLSDFMGFYGDFSWDFTMMLNGTSWCDLTWDLVVGSTLWRFSISSFVT